MDYLFGNKKSKIIILQIGLFLHKTMVTYFLSILYLIDIHIQRTQPIVRDIVSRTL